MGVGADAGLGGRVLQNVFLVAERGLLCADVLVKGHFDRLDRNKGGLWANTKLLTVNKINNLTIH